MGRSLLQIKHGTYSPPKSPTFPGLAVPSCSLWTSYSYLEPNSFALTCQTNVHRRPSLSGLHLERRHTSTPSSRCTPDQGNYGILPEPQGKTLSALITPLAFCFSLPLQRSSLPPALSSLSDAMPQGPYRGHHGSTQRTGSSL
jgi:hypothetical protein